ncbi:HEAT repeat domain-containing protein [Candidatus Uabimicrobium sp. HlEnr_7]|uniref:HEAT repeat domain-containing protein n=1 Tax=Candidatus Uabimicrobium helgolandensis TaxID=3095367 RepID=UPI003557B6C6
MKKNIIYLLKLLLIWPGFFLCKVWKSKKSVYLFLLLLSSMFISGIYFSENRYVSFISYAAVFWIALSISVLNHFVHKEKKLIIEGLLVKSEAKYLRFGLQFTSVFLFFIQVYLIASMVFLLKELSHLSSYNLFIPKNLGILSWSIYAIDLILKAVLFDIPEIFHWELINIEHVGFWGSSVVFAARLVILVLVLGSILTWRTIQQMIKDSFIMLNKYKESAETRLLLILDVYPKEIKTIFKYIKSNQLSLELQSHLLEVVGKSKHREASKFLEEHLQHSKEIIQLASVKAIGHLQKGDDGLLLPLFETTKNKLMQKEICITLGKLNTQNTIRSLVKIAQQQPEEISLSAISSLRETSHGNLVASNLMDIIFDESGSKTQRFLAKDILLQINFDEQHLWPLVFKNLNGKNIPNRRFAAMILSAYPKNPVDVLPFLLQALERDEDGDVRSYCAESIGILAASQLWKKHNTKYKKIDKSKNFSDIPHQHFKILSQNEEMFWGEAVITLVKTSQSDKYDIAKAEAIFAFWPLAMLLKCGLRYFEKIVKILPSHLSSTIPRVADASQEVSPKILNFLENSTIKSALNLKENSEQQSREQQSREQQSSEQQSSEQKNNEDYRTPTLFVNPLSFSGNNQLNHLSDATNELKEHLNSHQDTYGATVQMQRSPLEKMDKNKRLEFQKDNE